MTEREFLEDALGQILNYNSDEAWLSKKIDEFLEEHHKEYCEVEFPKIGYNCTFDEDGKFQHDLKCDGNCKQKARQLEGLTG
jgi:hypothetical protein